MIFPFEYDEDGSAALIDDGRKCTYCNEALSQNEKVIRFWWISDTDDLYLHVKCAEHVALMIMRDVAECRCGREVAQARYRQVRKIVPHP
jgi:hypothetical protein